MSVVGAGSVGTAIAYACLIRGSADALALYDTNSAKVRAEVLDLNHGTQFTPPCTVDGGDDISVTAGSDLVVVTAGAKQHPGQSRLELAAVNVKIAQTLTEQLLAVSPDAVLLFVTNPVDVATYAAIQAAGPSYRGRIFGSGTVLDTARLRFLLATELGVAVENVHAFIVGEHGDFRDSALVERNHRRSAGNLVRGTVGWRPRPRPTRESSEVCSRECLRDHRG